MIPSFSSATTWVLIADCFSAEWYLCGRLLLGHSRFDRSMSITIDITFAGSGRAAVENIYEFPTQGPQCLLQRWRTLELNHG